MQIAAQMAAEGIDNQVWYNQSWTNYKPGAGCNEDARCIAYHTTTCYKCTQARICWSAENAVHTPPTVVGQPSTTQLGKRSVLTDVLTIKLVSAMKMNLSLVVVPNCSWEQ